MDKYNSYNYIAASGTTVCKADGPVVLRKIIVGETAAGTISVYTDTTSPVAVLKASIVEGDYEFNVVLRNGLSVVTAANSKITVVWSS